MSGKRTLTKLNAFDGVVTVALGSTIASTIMSKSTALAEGATAFAVLIGLQFVITFLSVRIKAFSKLVEAEPRLLLLDGQFLDGALTAERVTLKRRHIIESNPRYCSGNRRLAIGNSIGRGFG